MFLSLDTILFATLSNCGKPLRASTTTFIWKQLKGTRLKSDPKGKNVEDWAIRSQAPNVAMIRLR